MKKNLILAGLAVLAVAACEKSQGPEGGKTPEPKDPAIKAVWACKLSDGGKMDGLHPAIDANGNVYKSAKADNVQSRMNFVFSSASPISSIRSRTLTFSASPICPM